MSASTGGPEPAAIEEARRRVFGLCRLLLGSTEMAKDATSEVFVRTLQAMDRYDVSLPFVPWVIAIARNHCLDLLRRRKLENRLFTAEPADEPRLSSPSPSPLGELLGKEERARVREALDGLAERSRVALVLRYYEDLGYAEIGQALGLTAQGVGTLIFRAKRELRERLATLESRGIA